MEKLEQDLVSIGLSEKEAQIYLSSLALGSTSVQNITKRSGINRVTTYVMIEQLTQKGLMSSFVQGKKKLYVAEKPARLLSLIQEREKELNDQEAKLKRMLGPLNALMVQSENKTQVRFYEGIEGLKAIHGVLLSVFESGTVTEYCEIIVPSMSGRTFDDGSSPAREEARRQIIKRKIVARKIYVSDDEKFNDEQYEHVINVQLKFLSEQKYQFNGEIGVYGSYTVFWLFREDYSAVMIDNVEMANNMKIMFSLVWEIASSVPLHHK